VAPPIAGEPVLIAGGGLSGLAAAVHLSARSVPVVLVEQRPHLGGRELYLKFVL
jgi:heterodisulfide reductase subunit A-like polyferredoxin